MKGFGVLFCFTEYAWFQCPPEWISHKTFFNSLKESSFDSWLSWIWMSGTSLSSAVRTAEWSSYLCIKNNNSMTERFHLIMKFFSWPGQKCVLHVKELPNSETHSSTLAGVPLGISCFRSLFWGWGSVWLSQPTCCLLHSSALSICKHVLEAFLAVWQIRAQYYRVTFPT